MNLEQIKSRVNTLVGELESSPINWSASHVLDVFNRVYKSFARDTGALENKFSILPVAGQREYEIPEQAESIFRVAWEEEKIFPATINELDLNSETWMDEQGDPIFYHINQLDTDRIAFWRTPDETESSVEFDSELGTIVDLGTEVTDVFRFESDEVTLGTVVDYEQTDDTVTFAIAASGGGANSSHGIVVNMEADDDSDEYSFSADIGTLVNLVEDDETTYDSEVFIEAEAGGTEGHNTQTTELGVVTDIDDADGTDVYLFLDATDGTPFDSLDLDAEVGTEIAYFNGEFDSELGAIVSLDDEAVFDSEYGIMVGGGDMEVGVVVDWDDPAIGFEIWAKEDPTPLSADEDEPELPPHAHMGLVYLTAAELLQERNEAADPGLAKIYLALGDEYRKFTKSLVARKAPEQRHVMRSFTTNRSVRRLARLPGNFPAVRY